MKEIQLQTIDNIVDDDSALDLLVKRDIGFEEGTFVFSLPIGTSIATKEKLDAFCAKLNFMYNSTKRNTNILPSIIKVEVIPEPVVIAEPEPVVVVEPVAAPAPAFVPKRKK